MHSTPRGIWSRDFVLLFGSAVLFWASFYFLFPILPVFTVQRLRADPSQVGLVSSMMSISAILVRPFAGYALDRWGRRWIQIAFLLVFSAVLFSFNLIESLALLLFIRLLQGIPFGVSTTASVTVATDLLPLARRAEGLAYFGLAQTIAMAVAPTVALYLLDNGQFTAVFGTATVVALGATVLAYLLRHPPIRDPSVPFSLRGIFEQRVLWLSLVQAFISLGYGGIVAFITLYAVQLHIANAGLFFTLYAAGTVLSYSVSGRVFDRRGPVLAVGVGLGLLCASYALLALWQAMAGFLSAAFVMGVAMGSITPSLQAMAVNLVPATRRGAASSSLFLAFDLGVGIGAYLLGALARVTGDYAVVYLVSAGVLLLPALLFFVVVMPRYRRQMAAR